MGFSCSLLAATATISTVSSSAFLPCCRQALGTPYLVSYRLFNTQRHLLLNSMVFSCKGFKCVKIGKKWSRRRVQLHKAAYICMLQTSFGCLIVFSTIWSVFSYWAILLLWQPLYSRILCLLRQTSILLFLWVLHWVSETAEIFIFLPVNWELQFAVWKLATHTGLSDSLKFLIVLFMLTVIYPGKGVMMCLVFAAALFLFVFNRLRCWWVRWWEKLLFHLLRQSLQQEILGEDYWSCRCPTQGKEWSTNCWFLFWKKKKGKILKCT